MKKLFGWLCLALCLLGSMPARALTGSELLGIWKFEYSTSINAAAAYNLNFEFRADGHFRLNILNDPDCAPLFIEGQYLLGADLGGYNLLALALTGITCGPESLDLTQYASTEDLGVGVFAVAREDNLLAVLDLETEAIDILSLSDRLPTTPEFPAFTYGSEAIGADQLRVAARPPKGSESRDVVVELNLGAQFAARPEGQFAAGYQVFVAALVPGEALGTPGQPQWFVRQPASAPQPWSTLSFPLQAFLGNVAIGSADARLRIEVVSDTNLSSLRGTEFYIGYGLDGNEMLAAGRFRGFYKVR